MENEVAALLTARDAFQARFPNSVPRVFGWESVKAGQGWILQERMPGILLLEDFEKMGNENKAVILKQMANVVLACLSRHPLPSTIREFGGLDFNSRGEYVSAQLDIF